MTVTRLELSDQDLVAAVRSGNDEAFEELYRRYQGPIGGYVRRMVRDDARAEDLAQDAFFSALRHLRATEAEIDFKPWIYEIARNAVIDHWRRSSRAEEVSVDEDQRLRPSDRARLVGSAAPDSVVVDRERLNNLQGAFEELGDVQARALVMRDLEGMSYREIAETLDVSRSSVESTLAQARQRLEAEYETISDGRRCASVRAAVGRLAEGAATVRDNGRLARHARRCPNCRRYAREHGVEPLSTGARLRRRVSGLLPFPFLAPAGERAAAIVAAIAIAGAGGAVLSGVDVAPGDSSTDSKPAQEQRQATPSLRSGAGHDSSGPSAKAGAKGAERGEARAAGRRDRRGDGSVLNGGAGKRGASGNGAAPGQGAAPGAPRQGGVGGGSSGGDGVRLPNLPNAPNVPGTGDLPDLPQAPNLPGTPNVPNVPGGAPNLPQAPQVPSVPKIQTPQVPQTPSLPQPPSVPVQPPSLPADPGGLTDGLPG